MLLVKLMKHLSEGREEDPNYINQYSPWRIHRTWFGAQVRQLREVRGLMAKPNGKIIETPIRASFKDGSRVWNTSPRRTVPVKVLPIPH